MPFAFVQFTSNAEAQEALEKGRGAIIFGRPCRTEMVKANRTFIVQKKTGTPITIDEVERLLKAFGQLSKCEFLHPQLRDSLGYSPTVLVEFSMFDATRDLHTVRIPNELPILHLQLTTRLWHSRAPHLLMFLCMLTNYVPGFPR